MLYIYIRILAWPVSSGLSFSASAVVPYIAVNAVLGKAYAQYKALYMCRWNTHPRGKKEDLHREPCFAIKFRSATVFIF